MRFKSQIEIFYFFFGNHWEEKNSVKNINKELESSIIKLPPLPDDPMQRRPDLSLAKKLIGWDLKFDIDRGLALTIDYFRKI